MRYLLFTFMLSVLMTACSTIEQPTVQRIENVKIGKFSQAAVEATADMVIHNPNPVALDLAAADLVAIVEGVEVATIKQTFDTSMPANADFNMPISLKMELQKLYEQDALGAMGKAMQIYSARQLVVTFRGSINVGKGTAKISVPVDKVETIKF